MGKSVIIIGAGVAGLSTGCYCQINGYRSHIYEHHSVPGGVAATWKRKDFTIDSGIHFIMSHKPGTALHELYRDLGVAQANRFVDMTTYGRFIDEASGNSVEVTKDLDRLANDLKSFSPADAKIIDELIAGSRAMQGLDMSEVGMSKPPELVSFLDKLKEMWSTRRLLFYFTGKYSKTVAEYTQGVNDPWLREFIKNLFLPEVPVWFIFMILALLADGQLALLKGGCLDFVKGIEKHYKSLGGKVTYEATVEKILVDNGRAVGVRLTDGSEYYADIVVSAADGYNTIFKMLSGRYLNRSIRDRYKNWGLFRPLIMVSYGVRREFPDEPAFTTIKLQQPFAVAGHMIDGLFIRIFNYSPEFAPKGKAVIQVEFETEWDYWNNLQRNDRLRYDTEKERIAYEIMKHLERYYPGISLQVEVIDVATPYTTWRYTLNHKGAWEGWMMTPKTINTPVERTLPGLTNFYMAGQWVMPGGGIPPCLYSGRHVVQLICNQDKKKFTTTAKKNWPCSFDLPP